MSSTTDKRKRQKTRRAGRLAEEAAAKRRQGSTRTLLYGVAGLAAIGLIVALVAVMASGVDPMLGVPAATVTGQSAALPVPPQQGLDPAVGKVVPTVEGSTPGGDDVTIGAPGTPQAVTFVAHWCSACQQEVPQVAGWVEDGALADGIDLVAVSTRHDPARPNWPPDEWLRDASFPGKVLVDGDGTAAEAWGLGGTPMWVFTNADGTVVSRLSGQITEDAFAQATALAAGS